ncbi:hypothetical protein L9F63_000160, partial [Diploptera punctata]
KQVKICFFKLSSHPLFAQVSHEIDTFPPTKLIRPHESGQLGLKKYVMDVGPPEACDTNIMGTPSG